MPQPNHLPDAINENPDQSDWYISRKSGSAGKPLLTRRQVLTIVFIAKDIIRNPNTSISKQDFLHSKSKCQELCFDCTCVDAISWQIIKDVLKNMKKKYHNKVDCRGSFNDFLAIARAMWRIERSSKAEKHEGSADTAHD